MRLLISLLAGCVAVAANAASFEDILEQTWLRYPPSQAVAARQDEAAAQGAITKRRPKAPLRPVGWRRRRSSAPRSPRIG